MESIRHQRKLVHEGEYLAEMDVELILTDDAWSPHLSLEQVRKLDELRAALRRGDVAAASKLASVYRVIPVNAA